MCLFHYLIIRRSLEDPEINSWKRLIVVCSSLIYLLNSLPNQTTQEVLDMSSLSECQQRLLEQNLYLYIDVMQTTSSVSLPTTGISCPNHTDVLLGRGVSTNRHPGNESFRDIVKEHVVSD